MRVWDSSVGIYRIVSRGLQPIKSEFRPRQYEEVEDRVYFVGLEENGPTNGP